MLTQRTLRSPPLHLLLPPPVWLHSGLGRLEVGQVVGVVSLSQVVWGGGGHVLGQETLLIKNTLNIKHYQRHNNGGLSSLTWESSTLRLLAWEERRPRLDQEVCEEDPARARRGERSVVHLRRMMTQLRDPEQWEQLPSYWPRAAPLHTDYWPVESGRIPTKWTPGWDTGEDRQVPTTNHHQLPTTNQCKFYPTVTLAGTALLSIMAREQQY